MLHTVSIATILIVVFFARLCIASCGWVDEKIPAKGVIQRHATPVLKTYGMVFESKWRKKYIGIVANRKYGLSILRDTCM